MSYYLYSFLIAFSSCAMSPIHEKSAGNSDCSNMIEVANRMIANDSVCFPYYTYEQIRIGEKSTTLRECITRDFGVLNYYPINGDVYPDYLHCFDSVMINQIEKTSKFSMDQLLLVSDSLDQINLGFIDAEFNGNLLEEIKGGLDFSEVLLNSDTIRCVRFELLETGELKNLDFLSGTSISESITLNPDQSYMREKVLNLFNSLTGWIPAKLRGKSVSSTVNIVIFRGSISVQ